MNWHLVYCDSIAAIFLRSEENASTTKLIEKYKIYDAETSDTLRYSHLSFSSLFQRARAYLALNLLNKAQRFVLFLGHPNTAATVVIGSLLLGAGLGATRSERLGLARAARAWPLVPALLAAGNVAMAPLFEAALGFTEPVRILIAVVMLLPVGYLLGHFFPLGMARFGDTDKAWFWAVNGACGVLAGVFSLALAMTFGFQAVAWIGVVGYVLAGLLFATGRRA